MCKESRLGTSAAAVCLRFAAVLFICAVSAFGQSTTASMVGVVRDQSGAAVPAVDVTARNVATSFSRSAVTDDTGSYLIPNLPVGEYTLEAQKPGRLGIR